MVDPYGTAGLRDRVLAAWTASPARFREDANTEEDFALGGYRDRVVVELAQNAADAAARAGLPGRLLLRLRDGVLTAANTGAPLDAAGVQALSTLRASAKRGQDTVGRFGVGFAAVVAVTDEPAIATLTDGAARGVMWSAARTRDLVAGIPELAAEVAQRAGHVPVLRLPFELPESGPWFPRGAQAQGAGFDTVVRLPLRDAAAADLVRRQLEQVGPALMLALPALGQVDIDVDGAVRTLAATHEHGTATINGARWRTAEAHGALAPELLADRPTEERSRLSWQLRWAILDDTGSGLPEDVPAVIHAPTPSAEPLGLPALLIASFPLAPDRRHVADGPLTDFLVARAAAAYLDLLADLPATPRLLDLIPGPVPAGALDARLRRSILAELPSIPLLPDPSPHGDRARVRGRDAVVVDGPRGLLELLADVLPGLLPPGWPVRHPALAALGVRRMEPADVVDALAALERSPTWWHDLYGALTGVDPEALGALPVPLADGRLVRGPRGLLIAAEHLDPDALGALELRFVHPDAAHPLLLRLGATSADPRALLTDPAVRAAVDGSYDAEDPAAIAEAVLSLVAAVRPDPGEHPWLAELTLPGADGEWYPAGELLFPDSPLREVVAADAPFGVVDPALAERYGAEPLAAAGVLTTFALVREQDVPLTDLDLHLDDQEAWVEDVLAGLPAQDVPPMVLELSAVRDLELVEKWDRALDLLTEPPLRAALVEPMRVLLGDGRSVQVPSYTAWWLRRRPVLAGRRPDGLRSPGADPMLNGLYDPAPAGLDPELLGALGVRTSLAEVLADPGDLLARLADAGRTVSRGQLRALWTALAEAEEVTPPARVRALVDGKAEVVAAADALVLDKPALLPLLAGQPLIITSYDLAADLAEVLDLPLAGEEIPAEIESTGAACPVPDAVRAVLPTAPASYRAHDPLLVAGRSVSWWYADGVVHVGRDRVAGLARGLAWATGRWPERLLVEAALRSPGDVATLLAESDLEPPP